MNTTFSLGAWRYGAMVVLLVLAGCSGASRSDSANPVMKSLDAMEAAGRTEKATQSASTITPPASAAASDADVPKEGTFKVKFESSAGEFTILVHRDWAPIGAQRFYELVTSGFYNDCRFFRVVPNFMVQFGIAADPVIQSSWRINLKDDPVTQTNRRGYITFATAGPNSRTTQVFINFKDNSFLDDQGFAPFGEVIDGMQNVDAIYSAYGESPDQGAIQNSGNEYLKASFPNLDYVTKASIVE